MFTGIIQELGIIKTIAAIPSGLQVEVTAKAILQDISLGDSIAINGACSTVTAFTDTSFTVQLSTETLAKTTFSSLGVGSNVNLETALSLASKLGGHLVSGHVDCTGKITTFNQGASFRILEISYDKKFDPLVIPKGSITIDGISLTVATLESGKITTHLIPHTIKNTTLQIKNTGDTVNLEFDLMGKYLYRFYTLEKSGKLPLADEILKASLIKAGFMS